MNYKGVIIEESLDDKSVLTKLRILKMRVEQVTSDHKTPWLKQWTLHTVEIPEEQADQIAQEISQSFDKQHPDWYADYKNNQYHFIVYTDKVFKVDLKNPILYKSAKTHGLSLGIPEYQLDFAPEDKVWERS